ncbi:MAG: anti-sigma factor [Chloroflexi bacterium]|nr:anti-sigma factor [Chloroflexota bacterium]
MLASNRVSGRPAVLWVTGLRPPPAGKEYQLWLFHQGRMWSPGTFAVRPDGFAWIEFSLPISGTQFLQGRVTIEPAGGSGQPTGEQVMTVVPRR